MATFVFFHAHPDDESIGTAGTMARAAADGHRTVLVVATMGEHGEVADGFLDEGEVLAARREKETMRSAEILGVGRVEFLGYCDSGMVGEPTNEADDCFWKADVDEAAERLAGILREEDATVLTIYDDNGGYGHPDHIQVHRVGMRAAELAGVPHVYQGTMNQDAIRRSVEAAVERGEMSIEDAPPDDGSFGKPEAVITHAVDVTDHVAAKRESMRAHASQIPEDSFFLAMPDDQFAEVFGIEWFIECGAPRTEGEPMRPWLLPETA